MIIREPTQVSAPWLTTLLWQRGALPQGEVVRVAAGPAEETFASLVWRLAITYSPNTPDGAPTRLFLKTSDPALLPGDTDPAHQAREITFYRDVAPAMEGRGLVPCYDAAQDPQSGASHLLTLDVSPTHVAGATPTWAHGQMAVDALAQLHAAWWDDPRLGVSVGHIPTPEARLQGCVRAGETVRGFMAAVGDQLEPAWRQAYEDVLAVMPRLFARHNTGLHLTLAHGDAHLGNFLFPNCSDDGAAYLIDWQFWHPTIGGTDLAFLMATEWDMEVRRAWEQPLLERYYDRLVELGVTGYPWEACWEDYRLSVMLVSIFIPVWRWSSFRWAPDLETLSKSMAAFYDLGCDMLLERFNLCERCWWIKT